MFFAMFTSADTKDGVFGPDTADIEFRAKSTWVMLRGNRYQVLEEEFYRYVLAPHNDVLKEVYGVGAADIAEGFQAMANATRSGHADAIMEMRKQFEAVRRPSLWHRTSLWVTPWRRGLRPMRNNQKPPVGRWMTCFGAASPT
jgi:hypothetical protein